VGLVKVFVLEAEQTLAYSFRLFSLKDNGVSRIMVFVLPHLKGFEIFSQQLRVNEFSFFLKQAHKLQKLYLLKTSF